MTRAILKLLPVLLLWGGTACRGETSPSKSHSDRIGPPVLDKKANQLERTDFTAYLDHEIVPGRNLIWCATMQLAWNEMLDLCIGEPPSDGRPIVRELNRKVVTRSDLDDSSYVAMAGMIEQGIVQRIRQELDTKFSGQGSPELLKEVDLPPVGVFAYSYLFKDLAFSKHFARSRRPLRFMEFQAQAFGFETGHAEAAAQVTIHDYRDDNDFVIELRTRASEDRLILAKVQADSTLHQTIAQVALRLKAEGTSPEAQTQMQVPLFDFRLLKEFDELIGIDMCGVPIVKATQLIRFKLDETGAKLMSVVNAIASAELEARPTPQLIFDKSFLVVMERQGRPHPYFALWVDNPELLVPFVPEKTER